ncbi:MAG TPA: hypothetical protein VEW07_11350 [Solirubrobacterales bacterium]|nr:hypothetical protein [Solirubrobacterales bacterium]
MGNDLRSIEIQGYLNGVWEKGDAEEALRLARELRATEHELSFRDAMRLVILLAQTEHHLFDKAADRWLERLLEEESEPAIIQVATAAVDGLRGPVGDRCAVALRGIITGYFDER